MGEPFGIVPEPVVVDDLGRYRVISHRERLPRDGQARRLNGARPSGRPARVGPYYDAPDPGRLPAEDRRCRILLRHGGSGSTVDTVVRHAGAAVETGGHREGWWRNVAAVVPLKSQHGHALTTAGDGRGIMLHLWVIWFDSGRGVEDEHAKSDVAPQSVRRSLASGAMAGQQQVPGRPRSK